nr:hypothetical protein GCM10020063_068180 [Dactylosporangium thailandense]
MVGRAAPSIRHDPKEIPMKITVKKVERIEATRVHLDPDANIGTL